MTKLAAFPVNAENALLTRRCCEIERENEHLEAALVGARWHRAVLFVICIVLAWSVACLATLLALTGWPR